MLSRFFNSVFLALSLASAFAQAPNPNHALPGAVAPGQSTELTFFGENLGGVTQLWTSFAASAELVSNPDASRAVFRVKVPRQTPPGIGAARLVTTNGVSGWRLVLVDDLPGIASSPSNHTFASAQEIKLPAAVDGGCEGLKSDFFQFTAKKGRRVCIEVFAQRLGSALDPLVRLLDAEGRELASNDDTPGLGADARIEHQFARSGVFTLELRDTRYEGGPKHRYRLRVGEFKPSPWPFLIEEGVFPPMPAAPALAPTREREPNDAPERAQRVEVPCVIAGTISQAGDRDGYEFTVAKGERLVVRGAMRSLGSPGDLLLQVQGTNGSKIAEANVASGEEAALTNTFTKAGTYRLLVEELTGAGGPAFAYRVALESLRPGFALSVESDRVSVPPGGEATLTVNAVRRDFDGPIVLSLAGLPEGFTLTNAVIPAKSNVVKLKIIAPDEEEWGRLFHFQMVGKAEADGRSFSATVSTLPALRQQFPQMLWPPAALDGWLALGLGANQTEPPPVRKKKRK